MKIRQDFVSNSSSCSFVLSSENGKCAEAFKLCHDVFKTCSLPYDLDDKVRISCFVKNKWYREVEEYLIGSSDYKDHYSDWQSGKYEKKNPEEVGWDSIPLTLSGISNIEIDDEIVDKIDHIDFSCEDSDTIGIVLLRLFYSFFERNDCTPDASDTEHSFLTSVSEDDFIYKLTTTCKKDINNDL